MPRVHARARRAASVELVDEADRRVRRREEADDRQAELRDREEPARARRAGGGRGGRPAGPRRRAARSRLRRTETSAISAATKNPSSSVRRTMTRSSPIGTFTPMARPLRVPAVSAAARGSGPARRRRACPAGTSFVTTAPAPVFAPSPISTRRDEHRVDAEERPVADRRPVLARAVVVGGDRAGADVRRRRRPRRRRGSSCGAASTPRTEARVLELGVVADLGAAARRRCPAGGG